jgi:NhaP-type Na+/H+ or K+/H+ antiporter
VQTTRQDFLLEEHALQSLVLILALGVAAQWVAWWLRLPSILFLLATGVIAGPLTGLIDPEHLFGDLLMPFVSLSVAIILFEGGLTLRLSELPAVGKSVTRLVTIGVLVTGCVTALAAHTFLDMSWPVAWMLGAVLSVTGPTVIGPLLRHVRPSGPAGPLLKWEGIVVDPVGAGLAVLLFEALLAGSMEQAPAIVAFGIVKTLVFGVGLGVLGAATLTLVLRRRWVPDALESAIALSLVIVVFFLSNHVQTESGLFAVTVMGIAMANQRYVSVRHLIEFKENLRTLILSALFVVLAARLDIQQVAGFGLGEAAFLLVLILVARPLAVLASTAGSPLTWNDRAFVAWMAPRGIVAAAISSVFAERLGAAGYEGAEQIVPATFMVIGATVLLYGLSSGLVARWLGLAQSNPQGTVLIGAQPTARAFAKLLESEGFKVVLVDSNWDHVTKARQEGLNAAHADAVSDSVLDDIPLGAMGRVLAMTANDEVNALACVHFREVFERGQIYQLRPTALASHASAQSRPRHLMGRWLFTEGISYDHLRRTLDAGGSIKVTKLTAQFDYKAFIEAHGAKTVPLFAILDGKRLRPLCSDEPFTPPAGSKLIFLEPAK